MNDEIFLLSRDEYEKYKSFIPTIKCWWWLRSPGGLYEDAAIVLGDGYADPHLSFDYDNIIYDGSGAVRPALRFYPLLSQKAGDRLIKYDFPWIYLGDELAIAEVPIAFRRFDEEGNDYETSEVRKFLLEWTESREEKRK